MKYAREGKNERVREREREEVDALNREILFERENGFLAVGSRRVIRVWRFC